MNILNAITTFFKANPGYNFEWENLAHFPGETPDVWEVNVEGLTIQFGEESARIVKYVYDRGMMFGKHTILAYMDEEPFIACLPHILKANRLPE